MREKEEKNLSRRKEETKQEKNELWREEWKSTAPWRDFLLSSSDGTARGIRPSDSQETSRRLSTTKEAIP